MKFKPDLCDVAFANLHGLETVTLSSSLQLLCVCMLHPGKVHGMDTVSRQLPKGQFCLYDR